MNLEGKSVIHKQFGKGSVAQVADGIITVTFHQGEKRFFYPGAFASFLTLGDKRLQVRMEETLNTRKREAESELLAAQQEQERRNQMRNFKVTPNSQAAFGCVDNDPAQVLEHWQITAGLYRSGPSKGAPRNPGRLKPNSACLVTQCTGEGERTRTILGLFMVAEDFFGEYCTDGVIQAHPQYRLDLRGKEAPLLWPFFGESDRATKWGSTELKYLPNTLLQAILNSLRKTAKDADLKAQAEAFYQHYCKVNRLIF